MSDLISRQAALEKVRAMQTYKLFMGDDMILVDKAEVQTELMMLPPAQPEPQWIPVSERLPETGVEVLTYDEALNYIEIQTVSDGIWENQRGEWQDLNDIDAWMPLPEAYKPNNK